MCEEAVMDCLEQPCRDPYSVCVASDFTSCSELYGGCLEPCEAALFRWWKEESSVDRDHVLEQYGF